MPLQYEVGQVFPAITLRDDREQEISIADVGSGQALILAFYRGPW